MAETPENNDVIAAFADGERVASDALKQALADERGRDYLVDLLALRGLVDAAEPEMDVEITAPRSSRHYARPSTTLRRPGRMWLGLAATVVASVLGGYAAGRQARPLIPLPAPSSVAQAAQPARPETAPLPTRVIRLEPGVDWKENIGG